MEDNFEGVKVMVIDDSKTIRRTAETLLTKAGCEVITATDILIDNALQTVGEGPHRTMVDAFRQSAVQA